MMNQYIMDNFFKIKDKDLEYRYLRMDLGMKVYGIKTWPMVKVNSIMPMVISMMVNGIKIKQMVMVFIFIEMEIVTKVNGYMISKMDMEQNIAW